MGAPTQAPGVEAAPFRQPRTTSKGSPAFGLGDLIGAACQLTSPPAVPVDISHESTSSTSTPTSSASTSSSPSADPAVIYHIHSRSLPPSVASDVRLANRRHTETRLTNACEAVAHPAPSPGHARVSPTKGVFVGVLWLTVSRFCA